ncbi:ubiquinol-cytochrome-c reductase complex assembly factor 2-like [Varroa destructor]|uniref:Uncharacterized protein n=1 Tax=Varroa destructor TaxID=109461 RepID=A0A7M7JZX4_VARDE|nr:ubiquinol-cytochrome-c reductase complex assembly factor 2-like [Varroa destructor]
MSGRLYNNLVALLPQFRVDPNRPGKCFGEFIRNNLNKGFPEGERSVKVDVKLWQENYEALRVLAASTDQKRFPRRYTSTATGITSEQCSQAIDEYLHNTKASEGDRETSITSALKKWLNI